MNTTKKTLALRAGILLAAASLTLAGCATSTAAPATQATAVAATADATAAEALAISDAWVKAADGGMSAAFGELSNRGDDDITIVAAEAAVSPRLELHETAANDAGEMMMREVEGGFVVPAAGSLTLEPGGNHIMLMDLSHALMAGDEITITLALSDGSSLEFTAPVKDFAGGNENYDGDMDGEMGSGH